MKKLILLACTLLCIFSLSACTIDFEIGETKDYDEIKDEINKIISETPDSNTNDDSNAEIPDIYSPDVYIPDSTVTDSNDNSLFKNVDGYWVTTANECYRFSSTGTFYWYQSYNNLTDNYYKGDYEIINSFDAIEELELDYSDVLEVISKSNGTITYDDFYCIKAYPTYLISGGIDKSNTNLQNNPCFTYLFLKVSDTSAQMINYQTLSTLYLTKK